MLFLSLMLMMAVTDPKAVELPTRVQESPAYHYIMFDLDTTLVEQYAGFQNLEQSKSMNQVTSFRAFSITKTFTAVAVMQLIENGRLKLEDYIDQYIPEYKFSDRITIEQLLSHQSGLANPIPLRWTHLLEEHSDHNFEEFADSVIMNNLKLKRSPGSKFSYSNLNYLILGRLIEKVSSLDYETYVTKYVIEPLGVHNQLGFTHPIENQARGYHKNTLFQNLLLKALLDKETATYQASKDWLGYHPFYLDGSSYGGLFANAEGLKAYGQALLSKKELILTQGGIEDMFSEQMTTSGRSTGMSLGWFVDTLAETRYVHHAGGGGGYYAEFRLYPELGVGSIVMMNSSGMRDYRILDKMDAPRIKEMLSVSRD
jgi:CubicO group peptidase (beta-lactamase class C family)